MYHSRCRSNSTLFHSLKQDNVDLNKKIYELTELNFILRHDKNKWIQDYEKLQDSDTSKILTNMQNSLDLHNSQSISNIQPISNFQNLDRDSFMKSDRINETFLFKKQKECDNKELEKMALDKKISEIENQTDTKRKTLTNLMGRNNDMEEQINKWTDRFLKHMVNYNNNMGFELGKYERTPSPSNIDSRSEYNFNTVDNSERYHSIQQNFHAESLQKINGLLKEEVLELKTRLDSKNQELLENNSSFCDTSKMVTSERRIFDIDSDLRIEQSNLKDKLDQKQMEFQNLKDDFQAISSDKISLLEKVKELDLYLKENNPNNAKYCNDTEISNILNTKYYNDAELLNNINTKYGNGAEIINNFKNSFKQSNLGISKDKMETASFGELSNQEDTNSNPPQTPHFLNHEFQINDNNDPNHMKEIIDSLNFNYNEKEKTLPIFNNTNPIKLMNQKELDYQNNQNTPKNVQKNFTKPKDENKSLLEKLYDTRVELDTLRKDFGVSIERNLTNEKIQESQREELAKRESHMEHHKETMRSERDKIIDRLNEEYSEIQKDHEQIIKDLTEESNILKQRLTCASTEIETLIKGKKLLEEDLCLISRSYKELHQENNNLQQLNENLEEKTTMKKAKNPCNLRQSDSICQSIGNTSPTRETFELSKNDLQDLEFEFCKLRDALIEKEKENIKIKGDLEFQNNGSINEDEEQFVIKKEKYDAERKLDIMKKDLNEHKTNFRKLNDYLIEKDMVLKDKEFYISELEMSKALQQRKLECVKELLNMNFNDHTESQSNIKEVIENSELDIIQREIDQIRKDKSNVQKENIELSKNLHMNESQIQDREDEIRNLSDSNIGLQSRVNSLEQKLSMKNSTVLDSNIRESCMIPKKLDSWIKENYEIIKSYDLKSNLSPTTILPTENSLFFSSSIDRNQLFKNVLPDTPSINLTGNLTPTKSMLFKSQSKIMDLVNDIKVMNDLYQEQSEELQKMKQNNNDLKQSVSLIERTLNASETERAELEKNLETYNQCTSNIMTFRNNIEKNDVNQNIQNGNSLPQKVDLVYLEGILISQKNQNDVFKMELASCEKQKKILSEESIEIQEILKIIKSDNNSLHSECKKIQNELQNKEEKISEYFDLYNDAKDQNNTTVQSLKDENTNLMNTIDDYKANILELQTTIKELNQNIINYKNNEIYWEKEVKNLRSQIESTITFKQDNSLGFDDLEAHNIEIGSQKRQGNSPLDSILSQYASDVNVYKTEIVLLKDDNIKLIEKIQELNKKLKSLEELGNEILYDSGEKDYETSRQVRNTHLANSKRERIGIKCVRSEIQKVKTVDKLKKFYIKPEDDYAQINSLNNSLILSSNRASCKSFKSVERNHERPLLENRESFNFDHYNFELRKVKTLENDQLDSKNENCNLNCKIIELNKRNCELECTLKDLEKEMFQVKLSTGIRPTDKNSSNNNSNKRLLELELQIENLKSDNEINQENLAFEKSQKERIFKQLESMKTDFDKKTKEILQLRLNNEKNTNQQPQARFNLNLKERSPSKYGKSLNQTNLTNIDDDNTTCYDNTTNKKKSTNNILESTSRRDLLQTEYILERPRFSSEKKRFVEELTKCIYDAKVQLRTILEHREGYDWSLVSTTFCAVNNMLTKVIQKIKCNGDLLIKPLDNTNEIDKCSTYEFEPKQRINNTSPTPTQKKNCGIREVSISPIVNKELKTPIATKYRHEGLREPMTEERNKSTKFKIKHDITTEDDPIFNDSTCDFGLNTSNYNLIEQIDDVLNKEWASQYENDLSQSPNNRSRSSIFQKQETFSEKLKTIYKNIENYKQKISHIRVNFDLLEDRVEKIQIQRKKYDSSPVNTQLKNFQECSVLKNIDKKITKLKKIESNLLNNFQNELNGYEEFLKDQTEELKCKLEVRKLSFTDIISQIEHSSERNSQMQRVNVSNAV